MRSLADCSVKSWTTDYDFMPRLLLSAAFAAVENLAPVTLNYVDLHKNWTWASAHSLCKKCSAVPLVIVYLLGL